MGQREELGGSTGLGKGGKSRHKDAGDTIPSPRLCPYAVTRGPGSQAVIENDGGLGTHRGASEASRAGGTRLTTVSLEEKEAD